MSQSKATIGIGNSIMFYFKIQIEGPFTIWSVIDLFIISGREKMFNSLTEAPVSIKVYEADPRRFCGHTWRRGRRVEYGDEVHP
jgi:hypothetical protein